MKDVEEIIKMLVEQIASSLRKPDVKLYFDMDGVLADFDGAIDKNDYVTGLKKEFEELLELKPELKGVHSDELKLVFRGRQEDPLMARLKKAWNKQRNASYSVANQPGHFINLKVLSGAHSMVKTATNLIGKLPHILTAPMESSPTCREEKEEWIQENFGGMYDEFHCTQDKHVFARTKYDILIDDRPKYTTKFEASGGSAILHTSPTKTIKALEETLEQLAHEPLE